MAGAVFGVGDGLVGVEVVQPARGNKNFRCSYVIIEILLLVERQTFT